MEAFRKALERRIAWIIILSLAACGGGGGSGSGGPGGNVPPPPPPPPAGDSAGSGTSEIVTANKGGESILVFRGNANGNIAPLRVISSAASTGLVGASGLALDLTNNEIAVADSKDISVRVFSRTATGAASAARVIKGANTGFSRPAAVAIDVVNNEIIVLDSGNSSIRVFSRTANGNAAPLRTVSGTNTGISNPWDLALDLANNEVVVADVGNLTLRIFSRTASGNAAPVRVITRSDTASWQPVRVTVDPTDRSGTGGTNGEILVTEAINEEVLVFDRAGNGAAAPIRKFAAGSGLGFPDGIAVDTVHNEIAVVRPDVVYFFSRTATGFPAPLRSLTGAALDLAGPTRIVLDLTDRTGTGGTDGEALLVDPLDNSVKAFDRAGSGNVAPLRRIRAASALRTPVDVALDPTDRTGTGGTNGEILVADASQNAIYVFDRQAAGDPAPLRVISGTNTGLTGLSAVALDLVHDQIVAVRANGISDAIVIFGRTASGNAAPVRTISGNATLLVDPIDVAVDPTDRSGAGGGNGEVFVLDAVTDIRVFDESANGNAAPLRTVGGDGNKLFSYGLDVDVTNGEIVTGAAFDGLSVIALDRSAGGVPAALRKIQNAFGGSGIAVNAAASRIIGSAALAAPYWLRVYSRTAEGNVAPLHQISGALTTLDAPAGVAFAP